MKTIEKIFLFLIALGIVLKFNLVIGASILIMASALVLAVFYGYFSFTVLNNVKFLKIFKAASYKGISGGRWVYVISSGLSLQALILGILFKLMWWPGSAIILVTGIGSVLISISIAVIKYSKHRERFYKLILIRCIPFFVFGLLIFFPDDLTIMKFQYRNNPAFIEAYVAYKNDPEDQKKFDKMEMEQKRAILSAEEFKYFYPEQK